MVLKYTTQGYAKAVEVYILNEEEAKLPEETFKNKIWGPFGGTAEKNGNRLTVTNYVD